MKLGLRYWGTLTRRTPYTFIELNSKITKLRRISFQLYRGHQTICFQFAYNVYTTFSFQTSIKHEICYGVCYKWSF